MYLIIIILLILFGIFYYSNKYENFNSETKSELVKSECKNTKPCNLNNLVDQNLHYLKNLVLF